MSRMRKAGVFVPAAVLLALAGGAGAETRVGDATMAALEGTCEDLVVADRALGGECSARLLSVSYPDGRVGFYFVLKDGRIVTFSGMDGDNPTPDSDVVDLDKVILSRADAPEDPDVFAATGTCSFGNPYKGAMSVVCAGMLADGRPFSARFRTNGDPPS